MRLSDMFSVPSARRRRNPLLFPTKTNVVDELGTGIPACTQWRAVVRKIAETFHFLYTPFRMRCPFATLRRT